MSWLFTIVLALVVVAVGRWLWVIYLIKNKKRGRVNSTRFLLNTVWIKMSHEFYSGLQRDNARDLFTFLPGLFDGTPDDGVDIAVKYIDTQPGDTQEGDKNGPVKKEANKPVILVLHGVPGSHEDFRFFLDQFGDDHRVLAPNFPDFSFSMATGTFWHSTPEKVEFLKQFLKQLNVTRLKSIVCHSAGSQPAIAICAEDSLGIPVDSIVLITVPGTKWLNTFQIPHARRFAGVGRSTWMRNLIFALWPAYLDKYFGVPETLTQNTTRDVLFWITLTGVLSEFETKLQRRIELLREKRFPTMLVLAGRDGLLKRSKSLELMEMLGATEEHMIVLDGDDRQEAKITGDWIRVVDFKSAGHFCFIKHHEAFHREVRRFFESLSS